MNFTPTHGDPRSGVRVYVSLPLTSRAVPSNAPRSTATYTRVNRRGAPTFEQTLREAKSETYKVAPGDTLSGIVHDRLSAMGRSVSTSELYAEVAEVARSNNIANPDVISVGETIDLSALDGRGGLATSVSVQNSDSPAKFVPTGVSRTLDRIVPGKIAISSGFGLRHDPFDGSLREHHGVDIAARRGTPIFPAKSGTVIYAGWHGGHGNTVIVRHEDGTETLYAHADKVLVTAGQRVRKSDELALVGSTGRSTGPHLHFEVRRDGVAIDPLAALSAHRAFK